MLDYGRERLSFPFTTVEDEPWDTDWARDWRKITDIFAAIEQLRISFEDMSVSSARRLTQQKLILDLEKYAYSLSKYVEEKYHH